MDVQEKLAIDEAMIRSVGDGLIVCDSEGKITLINPAAEKMLLQTAQNVIGKDLIETVPAADKKGQIVPRIKRPLIAVLKEGKSFTNNAANYYIRRDKTKFPAAITTSPLIYEGKIIGAIITFRDITRETGIDKMKTDFISLVSHQLRTPLSSMKWFLELLREGDAGNLNAEQLEFVKNVNESNNRMISLITDLLNITRIESDRIAINPKPTNLCKLLEEILKELKVAIEAKGHQVTTNCDQNLPQINVDPDLISAAYTNLLTNAIKYTPNGGKIEVTVGKKGTEIISEIKDNGWGIPENEKGRIFEKFTRCSNIQKKVVEGTGLGLYLVKSIVESSNGRIHFDSEEGKGTTFYFSIPISGMPYKKGEVGIDS